MTASNDLSCQCIPSKELSASICLGGETLWEFPKVASLIALIQDAFLDDIPPSLSKEFIAADQRAAALISLLFPVSFKGVSPPYLLADSFNGVLANLLSLSWTWWWQIQCLLGTPPTSAVKLLSWPIHDLSLPFQTCSFALAVSNSFSIPWWWS